MPNANTPYGLKPVRHAVGGTIRHSVYQIASALASNIYRGSPVIPVGTNKRIDVAAAGNRLIGVFDGVSYVDSAGETQFKPYWASGTALKTGSVAEAHVFDDPFILFAIQVSSATGLVATDIGNIADVVIGSGSAATGQSGDMLDQTTLTATAATGGQLAIEELYDIQGNAYGQYAKALVRINEHYKFSSTTTGQTVTPF